MSCGLARYGLATWDCFRKPAGAPGYLSLARVVALAEAVGGADHGFRWTSTIYIPQPKPCLVCSHISACLLRLASDTMRKACNFPAHEKGSLDAAVDPPHDGVVLLRLHQSMSLWCRNNYCHWAGMYSCR